MGSEGSKACLNVYLTNKTRLGRRRGMSKSFLMGNEAIGLGAVRAGVKAVSYTHLDVYKRQVHESDRQTGGKSK